MAKSLVERSMSAKDTVRKIFNFLHLDVTKNLKYDRLTQKIIQQTISEDSNCIDVGCHKGEILDVILKKASQGKHFAFEPIPSFYADLKEKYRDEATIFPYALSNEVGQTTFHYVKNAPAYSGINQREYKVKTPDIEKIEVQKKKLDDVIPEDLAIDLIKIDVEGGEFDVLKGAERTLKQHRPLLIFEFGNGASEFYDSSPADFFNFLYALDYKIYTLDRFLNQSTQLSREQFQEIYQAGSDYYFVAKVA